MQIMVDPQPILDLAQKHGGSRQSATKAGGEGRPLLIRGKIMRPLQFKSQKSGGRLNALITKVQCTVCQYIIII